jgi:hypothetical protein
MFEKIGRLAETAANKVSVSRRGFLGRLGQGALAMTGVLGGLLAIPTAARAAGSYLCCTWTCERYGRGGRPQGTYKLKLCYPPPQVSCGNRNPCIGTGALSSQTTVSSCNKCT